MNWEMMGAVGKGVQAEVGGGMRAGYTDAGNPGHFF